MKFKRDYKITVQADMNDEVFWSATHKGVPLTSMKGIEDYEVIAGMLNGALRRVERYLKSAGGPLRTNEGNEE